MFAVWSFEFCETLASLVTLCKTYMRHVEKSHVTINKLYTWNSRGRSIQNLFLKLDTINGTQALSPIHTETLHIHISRIATRHFWISTHFSSHIWHFVRIATITYIPPTLFYTRSTIAACVIRRRAFLHNQFALTPMIIGGTLASLVITRLTRDRIVKVLNEGTIPSVEAGEVTWCRVGEIVVFDDCVVIDVLMLIGSFGLFGLCHGCCS